MSNHTVKTKTNGSQKLGSPSAGDIYRKAARILERDEGRDPHPGCCGAIADAIYPKMGRIAAFRRTCRTPFLKRFEKLFSPNACPCGYWGDKWDKDRVGRQDCRILALCFMAAIVDSERPACSKRAGARRKAR